jgi:hypothetical protein
MSEAKRTISREDVFRLTPMVVLPVLCGAGCVCECRDGDTVPRWYLADRQLSVDGRAALWELVQDGTITAE